MTKTVLGLLRHGQTDWNIDFRLQGVTDIPLNTVGKQQAAAAAKLIHRDDWDVLLTSPLSRAVDTALALTEISGFSLPLHTELLLERSFGEAEGLTHDQWRERYANLREIPGGESLEQLETRASQLLSYVELNYSGKRVLAVTHGALIRKLIRMASNRELPREGERFGNTSLSKLSHLEGAWRIEDYNPLSLSAPVIS